VTSPLEGDLFHSDGSRADLPVTADTATDATSSRPAYWHVFGGPVAGAKKGANNFALITAGPVPKAADNEVVSTTIEGTEGETFRYLASFTHDPSDKELTLLKPKAFR
jgi:hypothetical protein